MTTRTNAWIWTWNNPDGLPQLDPRMRYLIYSEEMGESGTHHLQGYVLLRNAATLAGVKRLLGADQIHLEPRRGTHQEAVNYCSKLDATHLSGPYVYGTPPEQGRRTDLEELGLRVIQGEPVDKIISEGSALAIRNKRALQGLRLSLDKIAQAHWRVLRVIWFWGPSGMGKDRRATYEMNRLNLTWARVTVTDPPQWFDQYTGEQALILSDFKGTSRYAELLSWLDGHPLSLPVKGSFVIALYTTVIVTSIEPPQFFYPGINRELLRRVTDIVEFKSEWRPIGPEINRRAQVETDSENWEF